ncbi:head GIN domain-containing protein [Mariniflexile gromovii]|uniref:DUF2807 domain-containing protein n=1 Tax=Mariniflexile gromovii TaxID=362523 RepID=A0ABS4BTZ6_9FLAO|nr:head GIN domain-containing protein [Mariniflexile gromovii]MBP0904068.1 DUF2807 domain-containing protein [Mariniflexile gromovii]
MKNIGIISIFVLSFLGCSSDTFVGSGDTISEIRQVANFSKVSSEGMFEVYITKGNEQSVEIIADDNIMHRVKTKVSNGKLKLHLLDGNYNNTHLKAYITVKNLSQVENFGAGDIHLFNNYEVEVFKVINSGSASVFLEGSCEFLDIRNEGSGNIFAYEMEGSKVSTKTIGAGDIEVTCKSQLFVKIEGSGSLYYRGAPLISTNISGSGKVINDN